jgi:secreted trypsin-like serine protease
MLIKLLVRRNQMTFKGIKKVLITAAMTIILTLPAMAEDFTTKIIGGTEASSGEYPFLAALLDSTRGSTEYGQQFCGGTLINEYWVVTAAHCFGGMTLPADTSNISVMLGTNNLAKAKETISVAEIIVHENFESLTYNNDIALLRLSTPATNTPVASVSTTTAPLYATNTVAQVAGWGNTAYPDILYPTALMKASVPVVSNDTCNQSVSYNNSITTNMICAGYAAGGTDSCQGDSGGPLFVEDNGKFGLIGVVSFGDGCALPNKYGVYAKVANYETWIEGKTGLSITPDTSFTVPSDSGSDYVKYNLSSVESNSSYDVDISEVTSTSASFSDNGDNVNFNLVVYGGTMDSAATVESYSTNDLIGGLYLTKAKISFKVIPASGADSIAVFIDYSSMDEDEYKIMKCPGGIEGNVLTCSEVEDVYTNSAEKWAMFYIKNNDLNFDTNLFGVSGRDIVDKIDTSVYLARSPEVSDLFGGGGGGCSATGKGSPFGFILMIGISAIYLFRRKLIK